MWGGSIQGFYSSKLRDTIKLREKPVDCLPSRQAGREAQSDGDRVLQRISSNVVC